MKQVLVVGAGRVGRALFHMLSAEPDYAVRLADLDPLRARAVVAEVGRGEAFAEPTDNAPRLARALAGQAAVVSAAPFTENERIAREAARAGAHYFDITEDVATTRAICGLAEASSVAFVPQCGVAPGFTTIAGMHVAGELDEVDSLSLRVGALPKHPSNRLKYNLTWSTQGLVNEYLHSCEVLRDGRVVEVPALQEREEILLGGTTYEAFTTSGGIGSLCHTQAGRMRRLDYKTLRYPGHLEYMRFLLDDMGFRARPAELAALLERAVPATDDDFVIVYVRAVGRRGGRLVERAWWRCVEGTDVNGTSLTAIETITAIGVAAPLHLLLEGRLPHRGLVRLEDVSFADFMATPFARHMGSQRA